MAERKSTTLTKNIFVFKKWNYFGQTVKWKKINSELFKNEHYQMMFHWRSVDVINRRIFTTTRASSLNDSIVND